ncbi:hypothetical protein, partial [Helcococcus bovis]
FNIILLLINLIIEILISNNINKMKINFNNINRKIYSNYDEFRNKVLSMFILYSIFINISLNLFERFNILSILTYFIINYYFNIKFKTIILKLKDINIIKFNFYWSIYSILGIISYIFISNNLIYLFLASNYSIVKDALEESKTSIYKF